MNDLGDRRDWMSARTGIAGRGALVWWARPAVVVSFLYLVVLWAARPWKAGDTPFVLDGTDALTECLSRRDFVSCRFSGELDFWGLMSPMGNWPLLQHIPDLALVGLGVDAHNDRELAFVLLGVAGALGSVRLAWLILSRTGQSAWFWGFLLVVSSGPILFYARTTFGETLATGLLVGLVAATALQAPGPIVGLAALAASLTKETAYPFVALLGLLGLVLARQRTGQPIRTHVVWGGAGLAVGIALASLFNVIRFGSVLNTSYLEPELHTPGIGRTLEYVVALFVSPSGGMLVFWPAASFMLATACLLPLVLRSGRRLDLRPALVLVAVIAGLTIGFASWWTPFGWSGYGPRLTFPWVLPLVLIGLVAYGEALGQLAGRLVAPTWRLLLVFAVIFAFALPHVGQMWQPDATGEFFQDKDPPCDAPWRGGVAEWHECQHELMWLSRPMGVYALDGVGTTGGVVTSIAVAVALLGCLILLRDELPGDRGKRQVGGAARDGST